MANKNLNVADMSLDALIALKTQSAKIAEAVAGDVEALRKINEGVTDAKNVADNANTLKNSMWGGVFGIVKTVAEMTADTPDIRYQVFTDVLSEFLVLPVNADGTKPKLSTAGQYASTGRKLLIDLITNQARPVSEFEGKSRKDIMEHFRDTKDKALMEAVALGGKNLRYVVKHGTDAEKKEVAELVALIDGIYNPVKARKDKASKKAQADAQLRDDRQQQPAEGAAVEIVAGNLAGDGEEGAEPEVKIAVNG